MAQSTICCSTRVRPHLADRPPLTCTQCGKAQSDLQPRASRKQSQSNIWIQVFPLEIFFLQSDSNSSNVPFQTSLIKVMNVFIFELVNSEFHNIFQLLCHLSYKKVKLFQNLTQLLPSPVLPLLWSWTHSRAESLEEGMFAQWPKLDAWFTLSRTSHVNA